MAGLFSRLVDKNRERHFIVVDLGSDSAIYSLLVDEKNGELTALKKRYHELPRLEGASEAARAAGQRLHAIVFDYIRTAGRLPDLMIVGLGGKFEKSEVASASKLRKDPEKALGPAEIAGLINDYCRKKLEEESSGWRLVSVEMIQAAVDGYPLGALIRQAAGRTLAVTFLTTFLARSQWQEIKNLRSAWGGLNVELVADQYALTKALAGFMDVKNALVLKIGSATTEVTLLENGRMVFTGKTGSGGEAFSAAIAKRLAVSRNYAERIKRQWGEVSLPAETVEAAKEVLDSAANMWVSQIAGLLYKEKNLVLPADVFVLGGGAKLDTAVEAIGRKPWHHDLTFHKQLNVTKFSAEELTGKVLRNSTPVLKGVEETSLAALAAMLKVDGKIAGQKLALEIETLGIKKGETISVAS